MEQPWSWDVFWTASSAIANFFLGAAALKTLQQSQIQAESARTQTNLQISKAKQDAKDAAELIKPKLFVDIRRYQRNEWVLMITNSSNFPVIFRNISPDGDVLIQFTSELEYGDLEKTIDSPLLPGETVYVMGGSFEWWDKHLRIPGTQPPPRFMVNGRLVGPNGENINPIEGWTHGDFGLRMPFAYISPQGMSYKLKIDFEMNAEKRVVKFVRGSIQNTDLKSPNIIISVSDPEPAPQSP